MSEPALTEEQRMRAAVTVTYDGVTQAVVGFLYGVNHGRVAEACIAIRLAASDPVRAADVLRAAGFKDKP